MPATAAANSPTASALAQTIPVLVADVGGTNCRVALVRAHPDASLEVLVRQDYPSAEYSDLAAPLGAFLASHPEARGAAVSVAVAGPVEGDQVVLTNVSWSFSQEETRTKLGLGRLLLLNDLEAAARGVQSIPASQLTEIGTVADRVTEGPTLIFAPGTGLGVAYAFAAPTRLIAPSEGGHIAFAPADDVERAIDALLGKGGARVEAEDIVSGPGLGRLHLALAEVEGRKVEPLAPKDIVAHALAGEPGCAATVGRFISIMANVCGDLTVAMGAREVVLLGSIATDLAPLLQKGFRSTYEARGPNPRYMRKRPAWLAPRSDLGLLGAALFLGDAP